MKRDLQTDVHDLQTLQDFHALFKQKHEDEQWTLDEITKWVNRLLPRNSSGRRIVLSRAVIYKATNLSDGERLSPRTMGAIRLALLRNADARPRKKPTTPPRQTDPTPTRESTPRNRRGRRA